MTLRQCQEALLILDPYLYVKCDMDNFSPYVYFDRPKNLIEMYYELSGIEQDQFDEFEQEYLHSLSTLSSWDIARDEMINKICK
jgi:hypothetical protein